MPVPETYSRRLGSLREDSYSFSSGANRDTGRPSYLSSYTSKYTSSLPPRPPYERKFSELNTSSTAGSRFLNGTSTGGSGTRSATNYGISSGYSRSSVSPARTTGSGIRRSLEGITSTATSSFADRLRSLEIGGSDKDSPAENNRSSSGYKYLTRNRDSSSALGGSGAATATSRYGGFGRDRSGSRELNSSPLTTSSMTLGSRTEMKSDLLKNRSPLSDGTPLGSSYGRTSRLTSSSNGIGSRLTTGTEVTNNSSSVVSSSGSESTSAAAPTTNSVVSSNKQKSKNEAADAADRDVENNDDPRSSSSTTTTTSTVSSVSSSAAMIECSASPITSNNDDEVVVSLQNSNGNDTVILSKDFPSSSASSSSSTEKERRLSCGGGGNGGGADTGSATGGDVIRGGEKDKSPTAGASPDSSPTTTSNNAVVYDQDTNGNPILVSPHNKDSDDKGDNTAVSSNSKTSSTSSSASQTVAPTKTKLKATSSSLADSNANVVETPKKSLKSASSTLATSASSLNNADKAEIGVKKSLLKPNPLGSTKVQTKSKIIIHKFKVDDGGTGEETKESETKTTKPTTRRSVKSASPNINNNNNAEEKSKEDAPPKVASATTTRRKSGEEDRHSNNDVTATISLKSSKLKPSLSSTLKEKSKEDAAANNNNNATVETTANQNSSLRETSPAGAGSVADRTSKSTSVERTIVIKRATPPPSDQKDGAQSLSDNNTLKEPSKSRSPSPSTSVTITLSPPRKTVVEESDTRNSNDLDTTLTTTAAKAPSPPPLPKTTTTPLTTSSYRFRRDQPKDVTSDAMAGPHSSKYAGRQGKSDSDRSSTERDYRTTTTAAATTRNTYVNSTSDSSDNDSEEYSRSPPTTGRFRTRDAEKAGLAGLRNIGNTCFMNSVLQCLSNTKPLLEYVNNDSYLHDINSTNSSMKGALMRAFAQLIQELWRETRPVDTSAFKDQIQRFAPRFMGYSQQDAQEFLRYLLEGLHEDVNRVTVKPKPITTDIDDSLSESQKAAESWKRYLRYDDSKIVDIFVGQLKSTLRCTTCGHCSVTFDPFWDLSLPIPARVSSTKLSNCFELFTREEVLDGDEKPTCSKCQCRRKCTKSLSIQKFPKILVIHLKRFSPMERYRGKLSTTVEYPLKGLDLTAFAANSAQHANTFNLYGISNHSGSTYSGHYIAYCKHPYSGEWHCYNDSRVSPVTTNSVISSEGYVLFYEMANQSSHL